MLGTTATYKSIDVVNIHRNTVQLACNTGTHTLYLTVECATSTLQDTLRLMFTFPVVVDIDHGRSVTVNDRYFGQFVKLSLEKGK